MTPFIQRTEKEIEDQIQKAENSQDRSVYPGMTYEQGMIYMYEWLIGEREDLPMEED